MRTGNHSVSYSCRKVSIPKRQPEIIKTRIYKNSDVFNFMSDLKETFNTRTTQSEDPNE